MKTDDLTSWAIQQIETKYKDDVCLLLAHKTLTLEKDQSSSPFSYFIPATSRASALSRTFIIADIGYDLFPRSWERIEKTADIKEYNTTVLADAEILWARSEDDRQRFTSLQARLHANLKNPQYMLQRAKSWFNTTKEIYQDTLFEERLNKIRENAGYICDLLAIAVAFVNGQYFKHGQTNQLSELKGMKKLPENFAKLYQEIINEPSPEAQKRLCHEIITSTKAFLEAQQPPVKPCPPDYNELTAWYHELSYTWRRVYHWCDSNDPVNAYIWCCMLQNEAEEWGNKYGIAETDILSFFRSDNLLALRKRAEYVQKQFIQAIEESGVQLDQYATVEDFLNSNQHPVQV